MNSGGSSAGGTSNSKNNTTNSVITDYSLTKESFICNECGTDFLNRDTLAMHVMENVREGTCQKAMNKFAKVSSSNGNAAGTNGCSVASHTCVTSDNATSPAFPDRLAKKPRDALRSDKSGVPPPLPGCTQNLFKTLINPLTLPGWLRLQQASLMEPVGVRAGKDPPWCTNTCPYNGDVLMPLHHPNRLRPDSLVGSESIRRRMYDRRELHMDASELRKRRVEKWKESVGRERQMVNWLACKTLAMLNGQQTFKMQDALGQMLNVIDYAKSGIDPNRVPTQLAEACSVSSSENRPELINSEGNRTGDSRKPTPTLASKSDAMSSSWTGESVLEFKVSDSTEPTKLDVTFSCDSVDTTRGVKICRPSRSKSTPPRLDSQTGHARAESNSLTMDIVNNCGSNSYSEMMQDSGLGSEPGTKLESMANNNVWPTASPMLNPRSSPRKPGLGRSILGKRTSQKSKRLRRSAYITNRLSRRNVSPVSGADSTSCRTSVSSSNSSIRTPVSTVVQVNKAQSRSSQTTRNPSYTSEFITSVSEERALSKNGVILPFFCSHCKIGFGQKTLFSLHMGLHCVDQPWKCNMCGQFCSGVYEFTAHTLHF